MCKPPIKLGHNNTTVELTDEQSDIVRKKLALIQSCFETGEWFPSYLNGDVFVSEMRLLCDVTDARSAEKIRAFHQKLIDCVNNQPPLDIHTAEAEPYPVINGVTIKPISEEKGLLQPDTFYTYTNGPGSSVSSKVNHFEVFRRFLNNDIPHLPEETVSWFNDVPRETKPAFPPSDKFEPAIAKQEDEHRFISESKSVNPYMSEEEFGKLLCKSLIREESILRDVESKFPDKPTVLRGNPFYESRIALSDSDKPFELRCNYENDSHKLTYERLMKIQDSFNTLKDIADDVWVKYTNKLIVPVDEEVKRRNDQRKGWFSPQKPFKYPRKSGKDLSLIKHVIDECGLVYPPSFVSPILRFLLKGMLYER